MRRTALFCRMVSKFFVLSDFASRKKLKNNPHFSVPDAISMDAARFPEGKIVGSIFAPAVQDICAQNICNGEAEENFLLLFEELKNIEDRAAWFSCRTVC